MNLHNSRPGRSSFNACHLDRIVSLRSFFSRVRLHQLVDYVQLFSRVELADVFGVDRDVHFLAPNGWYRLQLHEHAQGATRSDETKAVQWKLGENGPQQAKADRKSSSRERVEHRRG